MNVVIGGVLVELAKQLYGEAAQFQSWTEEKTVEENLELQSEVLNGFIDLYSEDDRHDSVVKSLNVIGVMENVVHGNNGYVKRVKERLKYRGKGQDKQLARRLEETLINVTEFIKYKKAHGN